MNIEIQPTRLTLEGKDFWRFADGTLLPVVSGGDGPTDPPAPEGDVLVLPPNEPEPTPTPTPEPTMAGPGGKTFSQDDIERARQEEKDKLYARLQGQEEELRKFREAQEAQAAAAADAQAKAEEAARKAAEEEMSAKELLEKRQQEWDQRFAQMEQRAAAAEAVIEQERAFQALQQYRAQRLEEEAENILPELLDLVTGTTQEEVEASLSAMKTRTANILGNVAAAQQQQRQQARGVPVTAPPVGPMDNNPEYETVTADDIRNMDMATYMKNRDRLLGAASQRTQNRGLYG